jgi:hypothetical protein
MPMSRWTGALALGLLHFARLAAPGGSSLPGLYGPEYD